MSANNKMAVHFSSATDLWATPQDLFDRLNKEFAFETDVCATAENAKCKKYYTREQDGLNQRWFGMCWMNPPYGREIGKWVEKAWDSRDTAITVALLPARTDTAWFQDHIMNETTMISETRFLRGRLKFGGHKNSAPFPSCVVIFK